jgi:hypothetical protein
MQQGRALAVLLILFASALSVQAHFDDGTGAEVRVRVVECRVGPAWAKGSRPASSASNGGASRADQ